MFVHGNSFPVKIPTGCHTSTIDGPILPCFSLGLRYILETAAIMTEVEQSILETLRGLESAVAQMATARPKPNLAAIFERIDVLTEQLPKGTDPQLLHFLHRKSYQKARALLEQD